ncbi:class I SAM-dependent DNA methyltransferase [Solirubrobacter soli]|uniref:class I SAM-dependent DNA methyltransferase n=1 Tax=Solirubrobacter soli TaxID=363832 RepID=UPI0003FE163C|nr:class I SAM-dependent methyltransferase [Solirubrobacter soli]
MPTILTFPGPRGPAARPEADPVRLAYDALAPAYDAFTADSRHDLWLGQIDRIATERGVRGRRALDLACGTGKSFLGLLERGYAVTACDLSPEMAQRATAKAPAATVLVADMRALPALGTFDLVTCLDDAFNELINRDELARALAGVAGHLAADGIAVWDVNTLATVRSSFSRDWIADRGEWVLAWHGTGSPDVGPGAVVEARIDAFRHRGAVWSRSTSRHRQRHWPPAEVTRVAREAGLEIVQVLGRRRDAQLEPSLDEQRHAKALFVARRSGTSKVGLTQS